MSGAMPDRGLPILTVAIRHEQDAVSVRQRTRQIASLLGFDSQDQTRIATAVSEIARNAFRYAGGGQAEFSIEGKTSPQTLIVHVCDHGPGIPHLIDVLEGRYTSKTGIGFGIVGARRLVDQFEIRSLPGAGTDVWLRKAFPRRTSVVTPETLSALTKELASEKPRDLLGELELQNKDLLRALDELRKRQEDLVRVNRELEDTNRGVVALYAELDENAVHLKRADDLKSKFLSNMSHEFRSPLNSILALTGILLSQADGPLNTEQTQQVGFIRRAADDLYELVNDLLDLAKVEAGKVEIRPAYFEVQNLFGALRGMLRPLFLNQSVALVFEDASTVPELFSDEGKISQILRNFLSNALKFTERGEVRVSAKVQADRVQLSVADTGIGIAKEDQDRIFQDFVQVDGPIQRKVKGTGLGLPLSKKLAHLLKGDVFLSSSAGMGSTFTLDIPMKWEQDAEAPQKRPIEPKAAQKILIIDDDDRDRYLLKHRLRECNVSITEASTGKEGISKAVDLQPKLIFLDLTMPGMNGAEVLKALKSDPRTEEIPVVIHTSMPLTEDEQRKLKERASGILFKDQTAQPDLSFDTFVSQLGEPGKVLSRAR